MKQTKVFSNNIAPFNPFKGPKVARVIFTTQSQAEIWLACKMGGDDANKAYNESVTLILKGDLKKDALFVSVEDLLVRHESLRSVFSTDGRFMTIFETISITPFYKDICNTSSTEKEQYLENYLNQEANYNFDLVRGPLIKISLIKVKHNEHHFIITAHHIICDGWSTGVILEELGDLYSSKVSNTPLNLSKADSFSDYANNLYAYKQTQDYKKVEHYWINEYRDLVPQLALPTDFPRPEIRTYKCGHLDYDLDDTLIETLKSKGAKVGSSLVTSLMSIFEIFLYSKTGQQDIVVGLPSADQASSGNMKLVGHCVNLLPIRSKIDLNLSLNEFLKHRKLDLLDAYENQQLSFGELLQKLQIKRDPSIVPLVPVTFNIDAGMSDQISFTGLNFILKSNPRAYEVFDLFLNVTGSGNALAFQWSYNSSLFKHETIVEMMESFNSLIVQLLKRPDIKLSDILHIDYSPYDKLNNTDHKYPDVPLHQLIFDQVPIFAKNKAIRFNNKEITYEQLENQVNQLTNSLLDKGLQQGSVIGICMPKSIELIVTLLAVMQCGATYLPLDSSFPEKRLDFMLQDANTDIIIKSDSIEQLKENNIKTLIIEDLLLELDEFSSTKTTSVNVSSEDVVYILYTSGSTGRPKGVQITHKNLVNILWSVTKTPGIHEDDIVISITTISFDIAMVELFATLLQGATLVLVNEKTSKDTRLLLDLIKEEAITVMQATPTTWQMLIDSGWKDPMPLKAISTGEALPLNLARNILNKVEELWNMYGPTETTIWSAIKQISKDDNLITIGTPPSNTQLYIINENNHLVKPGVVGELCIAGDGVAKGYWKRPQLTSEKFIKNSFNLDSQTMLYRTGDLAKLLPSGDVQCFGRIDQQVKIRGQRIELFEIEHTLDTLYGIKYSTVMLNEGRLLAYVVSSKNTNQNEHQINDWKAQLKNQIPAHMIPQTFHFVKEFPKTLNGKIDRKALLNLSSKNLSSAYITLPSTPSEKTISAIWKDCLKLEKIDINSDFFEIGGHSLVGVQIMYKLEKETGNRLPLVALLEHSTIKKLATFMDSKFFMWDSLVPSKT